MNVNDSQSRFPFVRFSKFLSAWGRGLDDFFINLCQISTKKNKNPENGGTPIYRFRKFFILSDVVGHFLLTIFVKKNILDFIEKWRCYSQNIEHYEIPGVSKCLQHVFFLRISLNRQIIKSWFFFQKIRRRKLCMNKFLLENKNLFQTFLLSF
jgi:hypothetical protein